MKKILLTCLMVCTLVMTMCMTTFAADSVYFPELPSDWEEHGTDYVLRIDPTYTWGSKYHMYVYTSDNPVVYKGGMPYFPNSYWIKFATYSDGVWTWDDTRGGGSGETFFGETYYFLGSVDISQIVGASKDIVDASNNVVFQPTPPPTMAQKVLMSLEEALMTLSSKVGGVMRILVLCGVGCLASLMALKLFGKVLPIFRV